MEQLVKHIEQNFEIAVFAVLLFSLGLAVIEFFWEWTKGKLTKQYFKEMLVSFSVAIPSTLTEALLGFIFLQFYLSTFYFIPWKVPVNWFTFLILILVVDLIHYATHYWEHKIRVLWAFHSVHHSSPIYNYSTAFRVVFIRSFYDLFYYIVPVLLGFHPLLVFAALQMVGMYQFWLHTNLIGKMGWFGTFMNTPSHHRVHHGSQDKYIDKNCGGILILWDKIFGTFQQEEETPVYGLTKQIDTVNPLKVHFHEYINLVADLKKAKNFREVLGYIFKEPGWKPTKDNSGGNTEVANGVLSN